MTLRVIEREECEVRLAERLERMVAEPAWCRFYMDKDEAALCAAALRTRSTQEGDARHMSDWLDDKRAIHGAKLAGNGEWYQRLGGDGFERIERPGEYCMLPWMRVTTWRSGSERIIEAPLTQVEFIEYSRSTQEGDKG